MRNAYKVAMGMAVLLIAVGGKSAFALDTREVVVERNEGLVEVPRHLGHVLATPDRTFSFEPGSADRSWRVYKGYERKGTFHERSAHLKNPDNLFHQTTYFGFDDDEPIGGDVVGKRLAHQLGPMSQDGLSYLVVGHADEVGSRAYNQRLSVRRAESIVDLLVEQGYERRLFTVLGRGKLDPVSFVDQAKNRRVELVVRGTEQAKSEYKAMRVNNRALTCRACITSGQSASESSAISVDAAASRQTETANPVELAPITAIEESDEPRQPTAPTLNRPAQKDEEATATMKALQQLSERAGELADSAGGAVQSFRADKNPLGAVTEAGVTSFQQLLNPAPIPRPTQTEPGDN